MIKQQQAFLLRELLKDVKLVYDDYCVPVTHGISTTRTLIRYLKQKFDDSLNNFQTEKYAIVHSSEVNGCIYTTSMLRGSELRKSIT